MTRTKIRILLFIGVSLILGIGISIILFLKSYNSEFFEDGTEMTGVICGVFFGVLMLLYILMQITKRRYYPAFLKKSVIFATRQMIIYHSALSVMGLYFLIIHIWFAITSGGWSLHDFLTMFDSVTGYLCTLLIFISVICGLLVKIKRKVFWNLHVFLAFSSIAPLIIHLLD
ncbi:MAG: hypothetical protein PHC62_04845 [Candidatus Izemoplasmatales bacterium]|jgi:nitrogen fixation-related uncharacterized protein|nr:hypothetical protein [Candidatus Izemoplasmatales bacterium]